MKFRIPVQELQGVVNLLGITAKMNTVELAGRVIIEAKDDEVLFLSNNMSTGILVKTKNAQIEEEGVVSIVFSNLRSFASSFRPIDEKTGVGAEEFLFRKDDRSIVISVKNTFENGKVSNGRIRLSIYHVAESTRPDDFGEPTFSIDSDAIKDAISKVLYAIDPNCMAAPLRGMCIRFTDELIHFVGTDGKVLSEFTINNDCGLKNRVFISQLDFVMGLRRLLTPGAKFEFEITDKHIKVRLGDVIFWGNLIIGNEFPQYDAILSNVVDTIVVEKSILLENIVPFSDTFDQKDYNRVSMQIENRKLTFSNDSARFICDCDFEFDGNIIIDINGSIFLKTIEAIKDKYIEIGFDAEDPSCNIIFDAAVLKNQKALIVPLTRRAV